MAVLMPITWPRLTSAPPELPGLIAASVWMASLIASAVAVARRSSTVRLSALTMPAVTVPSSPSGAADGEHRVADLDRRTSPSAAGVSP